MNKIKICALVLVPVALIGLASYKWLEEEKKEQVLLKMMTQAIESAHYQPDNLDDNFSKEVFNIYMESLDLNKKFFLKEDVEQLNKYNTQIDDQIRKGSYEFFEKSLDLLGKRVAEAQSYYREILAAPFDYNKDEIIEIKPEKLDYPSSTADAKEAWRKYLKFQTLVRLDDLMTGQEQAMEKKDSVFEKKTFEQLEEEARKKVLKSNDELFKRLSQFDKNDRLGIYLNSIASSNDPHTNFFAPKDKENFDITMSGRLEGIGATLQEKDGYIKVSEIVPGSPSDRQGQLKAGDVILKVAQGSQEPVDVVDMRLDKAVELIRGKKGTEVRLTVKKVNGSIIIIPIVRDVVIIEDSYAKSAVIKQNKKIGYIKLPAFYADFNNRGGRNSASDVKKELQNLKDEKIEGLIVDLRNNGGGSLQDVVDMTGYFIKKGPIVQVKTKTGAPTVMSDNDASVLYDGPLVILVNSFSASASEILAAAIQDYKRGVIVGSTSTYGKGTVQRFFNLDDYLPREYGTYKPIGSLKLTMQKFYRVNGDATQLKGVIPDIVLPDNYSQIKVGEKELDSPMAWDEISPLKVEDWNKSINIDKIKNNSKARVSKNETFNLVQENAVRLKQQSDKTEYPLNLQKYRDEQKLLREENKRFENIDKGKENPNLVEIYDFKSNIPGAETDTTKTPKSKDWLKNVKKDIYVSEAVNILNDIK